jgi:hypothetical protein
VLFLSWRGAAHDPYRLYNGLDEFYRPLGHPDAEPRPPRFPSRIRHFVYGCALANQELDAKLAARTMG